MKQQLREARSHGTSVFPMQIYSHRDKNGFYSVSPHWHDEIEWIYVDQGIIDLTVRGQSYVLRPNDFCFVNSGELHGLRSSGESYHHAIVFHPGLLDFALYDRCQHEFIGPVTNCQLLFPDVNAALPAGIKKEILSHMREIVDSYHTQSGCMPLGIKIHLFSVLELLFRSESMRENRVTPKSMDSMKRLKEVIGYVERNYASPITLEQLAQISCMSPNYFCHYFRKEIGKSPIAFIIEYRIQKAAQMLSETNEQISQIASAVGFDNFSYFIRKFRECKSVSPKEYRAIWMQQKKRGLNKAAACYR